MTTPPPTPAPAPPAGEPQPECLILPGRPDEVAVARRWLAGLLTGHPAADDAILALGELAANSVVHSDSRLPGGQITIRALITPEAVRVEVADRGGAWLVRADDTGQRGRGFAIVAALATDWGIEGDRSGRTAWCEIACGHSGHEHT